jgi:HAD superfamily hydrolase (TIGR01509 family)
MAGGVRRDGRAIGARGESGEAVVADNRAVIFDMDGVLINSEPLHFRATQEILTAYGVVMTEADYFDRYIAYSDRELMELLLSEPGLRSAAAEAKGRRYLELVGSGAPAFPDGLCLLGRIEGWRVGLATGSTRHEAELALGSLGIRDRFQAIVTREDCVNGKPHPEPFLRAAEALGLPPHRCVVIEDSPGGIQAAKAAGMRCVAVTHSCPQSSLGEADLVVDDLGAIELDRMVSAGGSADAG